MEVIEALKAAVGEGCPGVVVKPLERFAFYEESRQCFAVVQTLERRPYGNAILVKGVVGPGWQGPEAVDHHTHTQRKSIYTMVFIL